jgi:hypothetical protein
MRDLCRLIGWMVVDLIRSRVMLEAEIWTLRQQINVLRQDDPAARWGLPKDEPPSVEPAEPPTART